MPKGETLCIVAPHPDDEVIGCGGLLARWAGAGLKSHIVFLTQGEMGSAASRDAAASPTLRAAAQRDTAIRRRSEAETALAAFTGATASWLDGDDAHLHSREADIATALAKLWSDQPPDVIAAPCPLDRHADHAVAARIVATAAEQAALPMGTPVWGYEVWSPTAATGALDITDVAAEKWTAIACHRSQLETTDYLAAARGMGTYRAVTAGLKSDAVAEAYRVMNIQSYGALAQQRRV